MLRPRLILTLPAIALCYALQNDVQAGVALSPLQQQVVVKPGGTAEFALTVDYVRRTRASGRTRISFEIVDFAISREGVLSLGRQCQHPRSAVQWIALDSPEFMLEPGEVRKVTGKVSAPLSADGDYWAAVLMTTGELRQEQGVNVVLRTASAVFVRAARRQYAPRPTIGAPEVTVPRPEERNASSGAAEPAASSEEQQTPALAVSADVINKGIVGFIATGEARVYLNGQRQVATIPLHARRHHVLPGQERLFVGLLPAPLPAGDYTVRLLVEADSNPTRRAFEQASFHISPNAAENWQQRAQRPNLPRFEIQPLEVTQVLTPGRFTAVAVSITNRTGGTMQVRCRPERGQLPEGWMDVEPTEFTLGPGMRRSVWCRLRIPLEAEQGRYSGALVMEVASARLAEEPGPEQRETPVRVEVKK